MWNTDMSKAPRGQWRKQKIGEKATKDIHVAPRVIIASGNDTISISRWISDGPNKKTGRWEFLTKDQEPIAWFEFPEHPNAKIAKAPPKKKAAPKKGKTNAKPAKR
jgi:hypothetical protein